MQLIKWYLSRVLRISSINEDSNFSFKSVVQNLFTNLLNSHLELDVLTLMPERDFPHFGQTITNC